ncbi:YmfL family putative regulatory protein [Dickeya solani]|uniref:YmfL family putative regulatory protein n=1 Tax=Dickeya solani TaxID=1089444 RepID=A0ABU4EH57_9GAMM|nr:YmfL family putative regulatory protein [Dickeya solani]MCZ0823880.1 DNA-binding protein [Dickeya solani]MDV6995592.1 YmfL family putative regulatory protein [Dickeya solani]MDV7002871.1 YmfL family putative regulatory protein [Dickeya solani]MDV7036647.1 YmfL family putative regulatory protein [Dickeya solani]MDV7043400.1 YmfL family putative regulatory protein [Dickeya solani]
MSQNPEWQAEKQPDWVIAVARKIITGLPGGYADAAQWLGVTENALFNRLRADSNQIFPIGWLMVLQQAGGTTLFADAVSRQSNSVNVRLPSVDEIENGDVNVRLMEAIEFIGRHSELVRRATEDGVIDDDEKRAIDENSYNVIAKFQESIVLLYSVFCPPTDQASPHITPHQRE